MSIPAISYVGFYSHLAPITAGLVNFKRLSLSLRILLSLVTIFFFITIVQFVYAISRRNNLEFENIGQIVETVGICCIYIAAIKAKKIRLMTTLLLGGYAVLLAFTMPYSHTSDQIDALAATLGKLTLIISGIVYLYYELKYDTRPITQDPYLEEL